MSAELPQHQGGQVARCRSALGRCRGWMPLNSRCGLKACKQIPGATNHPAHTTGLPSCDGWHSPTVGARSRSLVLTPTAWWLRHNAPSTPAIAIPRSPQPGFRKARSIPEVSPCPAPAPRRQIEAPDSILTRRVDPDSLKPSCGRPARSIRKEDDQMTAVTTTASLGILGLSDVNGDSGPAANRRPPAASATTRRRERREPRRPRPPLRPSPQRFPAFLLLLWNRKGNCVAYPRR